MSPEFFVTQDGSHSLVSERFGVTYHSKYGAIQESMHVFIQHGLRPLLAQKRGLSLLELGFGTGLNALLTLHEAELHQIPIRYEAIEAYPISAEAALKLNYTVQPGLEGYQKHFLAMHEAPWEQKTDISTYFAITKRHAVLQDIRYPPMFDLVYYDAFAPSAQPELWESDTLGITFQALKSGGILVTYCAKGEVKRRLKALGFEVQTLQGPPGKREMIRCVKP